MSETPLQELERLEAEIQERGARVEAIRSKADSEKTLKALHYLGTLGCKLYVDYIQQSVLSGILDVGAHDHFKVATDCGMDTEWHHSHLDGMIDGMRVDISHDDGVLGFAIHIIEDPEASIGVNTRRYKTLLATVGITIELTRVLSRRDSLQQQADELVRLAVLMAK